MHPIRFHSIITLIIVALTAHADYYSEYIDRYAPMAVSQMEKHGIPASITLAQGLLESAAGRSTLATQGNNHFGIKCHADWTGRSMLRDDDAPDECFRVYDSPEDSFTDHSLFLRKKRYAPLFDLDPADYTAWAHTLRKCGYATDPNYADRLITIIERYALYTYDSHIGAQAHDVAQYIISTLTDSHPVRRYRGLYYVIAAPGDTYTLLAKEFNIDPKTLMRYNDVSHDSQIKPWEEVYLQPKHHSAPDGIAKATIGQDESMHSVAQRFAISMQTLKTLNPDAPDRPGTTLKLK